MFKASGVGKLISAPELKTLASNGKETYVTRFLLATTEYRRVGGEKKRDSHVFSFEAWDSGAKTFVEYAKKGDFIAFEARPRENTWEVDGKKMHKTVFRLEEFKIFPPSYGNDEV